MGNFWFGQFAVLVTYAVCRFSPICLWFSVFAKMMAVFPIFLSNAFYGFSGFAYTKLYPAFTLRPSSDVVLCCAQLRSGIKFYTTLARQQFKRRGSVAPHKIHKSYDFEYNLKLICTRKFFKKRLVQSHKCKLISN